METAMALFALLSIGGVAKFGWEYLADEILCGLVVLAAFFMGDVAQNGSFFGQRAGSHIFGSPDKSRLLPVFFAPAALFAGLVIGALFPPWSPSEGVAVGIVSAFAFIAGFHYSSVDLGPCKP